MIFSFFDDLITTNMESHSKQKKNKVIQKKTGFK